MNSLSIRITILFIFLTNVSALAQHEADFWYFGDYAGLDFSSGNPEPITNGALQNYEGCAVASDTAGNLLFYTNGDTIWNRNHEIMSNGTDLSGDTTSTQSAVIVPKPGNNNLYYVFTADVLFKQDIPDYPHKGLRYSIVNMDFESGFGEVINKNILLLDSVTEKITAINHQNGKDIWLISHEWGNDKFYSWLLTESGIIPSPIISPVGSIHRGVDTRFASAIGYLKASPDGNNIICAVLGMSVHELFSFDRLTGIISNPLSFTFAAFPYGCEFSQDGSRLYLSDFKTLFQVDLLAGSPINIFNSLTEIHEFNYVVGALQLAKNGKLYIANDLAEYLSVIEQPNELYPACNFILDGIYLDGRTSRLGLPNFNQSIFRGPFIKAWNTCFGFNTNFVMKNIINMDSVHWNFDDPASGTENTSNLDDPVHLYTAPGIYNVTATVWYNNNDSQYAELVKIVPKPLLELGKDTALCNQSEFLLNAYNSHYNYIWNDLSTDSVLTVNSDGKYWLEITNFYTACKNSDTINIIFSDLPEIDLGNDTSFCENSSLELNAYHLNYEYTWQNDSEDSVLTVFEEGTYHVVVENEYGCINSDTINLTHEKLPRFSFPEDTLMCSGYILGLWTDLKESKFLWSDGSTDPAFLVDESGTYNLKTSNKCGTWEDEIIVDYKFCGNIYIPNIFSPNSDEVNDLFIIKGIENEPWKLVIFNRWGQELRRYSDYDNSWNGTDRFNNDLTNAVYYYVLSNQELGEIFKGTVRIKR